MIEKRKSESNESAKRNKQIQNSLYELIVSNNLKEHSTNTLLLQNKHLENVIDTKESVIETMKNEREVLFKICESIIETKEVEKMIETISKRDCEQKDTHGINHNKIKSNVVDKDIMKINEYGDSESRKENFVTNNKENVLNGQNNSKSSDEQLFTGEMNSLNDNSGITHQENMCCKISPEKNMNSNQMSFALGKFKEFYIEKLFKQINDQNEIILDLNRKLLKTDNSKPQNEPEIEEKICGKESDFLKKLDEHNKNLELRNAELISEILQEKKRFSCELKKQSDFYIAKLDSERKTNDVYKKLLSEKDKEIDILKKPSSYENELKECKEKYEDLIENLENNSDVSRIYTQMINLTKRQETEISKNKESAEKIIQLTNKITRLESEILAVRKIEPDELLFYKKSEFTAIELENAKQRFEERKNAALFHKRNFLKCQMELNDYKTVLKDLKEKIKESSSVDSNKDVENLRALLRCTACDRNFKNTILLRCMHVFCNGCIEERIRTRKRNCPNCNENFHTADVKRIYL